MDVVSLLHEILIECAIVKNREKVFIKQNLCLISKSESLTAIQTISIRSGNDNINLLTKFCFYNSSFFGALKSPRSS
jgi:hypothetical protein